MSKELKVGLFVLSSLLIFLGTFVYVGQLRVVRIPYKTYFTFAGGVDRGSPVRFGGMRVGTITAIRQWREDPTKIEVLLELREGVPVNADSVAMLTSLGLLGDKYLEITTGSNKARRLPPGSIIPSTEPVSLDELAKQASALIPAVQATLQDVQKNLDQLTGNAEAVLANVQSMTSPQNQRNFTLLLTNARELRRRVFYARGAGRPAQHAREVSDLLLLGCCFRGVSGFRPRSRLVSFIVPLKLL